MRAPQRRHSSTTVFFTPRNLRAAAAVFAGAAVLARTALDVRSFLLLAPVGAGAAVFASPAFVGH
jgi:hypothetical protein